MRFVPVKSMEQQSQLFVHRARQGYVEQRTALINRIRGLLSELGIVLPLKAATIRLQAHQHLEDLPGVVQHRGGRHAQRIDSPGCSHQAAGLLACKRDVATGRPW
jgi:transposase